MSFEYDVFLSHGAADEAAVEELARRLVGEADLNPYLRRWKLIPGEATVPALEDAIERSVTIAVFFGPEGGDARRDLEVQLALIDKADRRIIPVLLPGAAEADVAGLLRTRTWVNMNEPHGFERLIAGITGQAPDLVIGIDREATLDASSRREPRRSEPLLAPTPYRVFVSSTLCDEPEHCEQLRDIIERVGMLPVVPEPLPEGAGPAAIATRRARLHKCDLFLTLVAWRYGRIPSGHDRSIGELDLQWARERGLSRLVFLVDEQQPIVVARDLDELDARWTKQQRLQAFKAELVAREAPMSFTPENVGAKLTHGLHQWRNDGAGAAPIGSKSEVTPNAPVKRPTKRSTPRRRAKTEPSVELDASSAEASEPVSPRRTRRRRATIDDVSRYLETVERDNSTTAMFGAVSTSPTPLDPDGLRVKVRVAARPPRMEDDSLEGERPEPEPEPELELSRVFEYANRHACRVVALVGPPGSGKSTHLRRIALWLSRRNADALGLPLDTVPVLLRLHELPSEVDDLRSAVAAQLHRGEATAEDPLVSALLDRDHLLFLVDGLDDLPTEQARERAAHWLGEGLREQPRAQFVITRRPLDAHLERSWSEPVLEVQLPPLDEPDARALVERWFRTTDDEDARTEARRRADALWSELRTPEFRATRLYELTRSPLMLAVLCTVHALRGRLPTRRVDLYEECLQVLVQRWCAGGRLPRRFGEREARQVLAPLAHWLHGERGRTHADLASVAAVIEPHLTAALGQGTDVVGFLRDVAASEGILTARGREGFGLLHPAFQEYLCARHLRSLSHGHPDVLDRVAEHFGDPWWREVMALLLALGEPPLFEPMMRRVMEHAAFTDHQDWVVEWICEASGASVEPLVGRLEQPPSDEPNAWRRQLAAAQILRELDPERLAALAPVLREHPHAELRRLVGYDTGPEIITRVSPRGGYALVEIPAGRFTMGSHHRERDRRGGEGPRHEVELASFWIGKYPVTNEEYAHYLRACPHAPEPAYWGDSRYNRPRQPVVGVSWHDAMAYCEWAELTLPTEAQWERACRADTTTPYWSGRDEEDLARIGWYAGNSGQHLHPVGEREPNPFGLYDVHGNVWEWCLDDFGDYEEHRPRPGDGLRHPPGEDGNRVIRGGAWIEPARKARSASRLNRHPDGRLAYLGFRAVQPADPDEP